MASILDFLDTSKGKEFIRNSSKEVDESPEKVKSVLGMIMPMILGGLKKKTDSPEGARDLDAELEKEEHNGSVLNSLGTGSLSGLMGQGSGILGHIFGGKDSKMVEAVSTATGMNASKVGKLLKMAAPVIMGILGEQKRKDGSGPGGISGLVNSALGSSSSHDQSLLETFLDSDGKGSIAKDFAGKIFGGKTKSKGLGSFFEG